MPTEQDIDTSFHAAQGRIFRKTINRARCRLYGAGAVLELHQVRPNAAPRLLATLTEDWAFELQFGGTGANFWVGSIFHEAVAWGDIEKASTATITTHGATVTRLRIQSVTKPADAAHSYQVTATPVS